MKKTNLILAILAALFFVSCCKDEKNNEPINIKLTGTWRYSRIVDLDSIANAESINLPYSFGKATFNFEWTFNEDKTTGFVNAYLDYKGNKTNAPEHPKDFEYRATETKIIFQKFPYESFENAYKVTIWLVTAPFVFAFSLGTATYTPDDVDVIAFYTIE